MIVVEEAELHGETAGKDREVRRSSRPKSRRRLVIARSSVSGETRTGDINDRNEDDIDNS